MFQEKFFKTIRWWTLLKALTKRTLDSLKTKEKSFNKYKEFWNEYGLVLKEGSDDIENRELIASLILFNSSNLSDWVMI